MKTINRTWLPKTFIKNGSLYIRSEEGNDKLREGNNDLQSAIRIAEQMKASGKQVFIMKVLSSKLKGREDLHGKEYQGTVWIFEKTDHRYYVDFTSENNSVNDGKKGRKYYTELPDKTYFAIGNVGNDPQAEPGQAFLFCYDNGTCLTPIYNMDDEPVIIPKNAGKQIEKGQLVKA